MFLVHNKNPPQCIHKCFLFLSLVTVRLVSNSARKRSIDPPRNTQFYAKYSFGSPPFNLYEVVKAFTVARRTFSPSSEHF